jgi:hypothetical protein
MDLLPAELLKVPVIDVEIVKPLPDTTPRLVGVEKPPERIVLIWCRLRVLARCLLRRIPPLETHPGAA